MDSQRAEKEARDGEDRAEEKAAKEAGAQRKWERQRAALATGIHGSLSFILYPIIFFAIVVTFVALISKIIGRGQGISIVIGMTVGAVVGRYLCHLVETRATEYQRMTRAIESLVAINRCVDYMRRAGIILHVAGNCVFSSVW